MKKWLSRGHRCEVSRVIAAPADVLYEMVSDLSRMGEWSPENVGGSWRRGSGPTVGGRFKGRNKRGPARWTTNVEVTAAEPGRLFEFVVHVVWPLTYLVTWGYRFEPRRWSRSTVRITVQPGGCGSDPSSYCASATRTRTTSQ